MLLGLVVTLVIVAWVFLRPQVELCLAPVGSGGGGQIVCPETPSP
jgi:hypothetical protein